MITTEKKEESELKADSALLVTEWMRWTREGNSSALLVHLQSSVGEELRRRTGREAGLVTELRARGAIESLAATVESEAGAPPTLLASALGMLASLLRKRVRRDEPSAGAGAKEDRAAVRALVSAGGAIDALRALCAGSHVAQEVRVLALRVLANAAYNGVRAPALVRCVGTVSEVLDDSAAVHSPPSYELAVAASAFLANITIGVDSTSAPDLFGSIVSVAVRALATAAAALETISIEAVKLAANVSNVLVHLFESMRSDVLASSTGDSLCTLARSAAVSWRANKKSATQLAVASARLAHGLVPEKLCLRSSKSSTPDSALLPELKADFVDADSGSVSPWQRYFAAAWHMGVVFTVEASDHDGRQPLFTVESPVREAIVLLALTIEERIPQAIDTDVEEPLLLHALLAIRCRLWLGGVVPHGVSDEVVGLWTELCSCGLLPAVARSFDDTESDSPREFAAKLVCQALAKAQDEYAPGDELLDDSTSWMVFVDRALLRAKGLLSPPWVRRLEGLAQVAKEYDDSHFDVGFTAMGLISEPLSEMFGPPAH